MCCVVVVVVGLSTDVFSVRVGQVEGEVNG